MDTYQAFLDSKVIVADETGFGIDPAALHPLLYDFQRDIVAWALRRGKAAVFADCGLGKSFIQLEWARHVYRETGRRVLIVAPLSVAEQTIREARKLDLHIKYVRGSDEVQDICITNYEMLWHFIGAELGGIVLDESSILKSVDGETRRCLLENFTTIPYRLCCTATPCPNDVAELANHSEFLGIMTRQEMLASFFVHDEDGWRLRGHAAKPFYRWLASWAMALKTPADLGYDGSRFILPKLNIHDEIVCTDWRRPGALFPGGLKGITDRALVRRQSTPDRIRASVELIYKSWQRQNINANGISDTKNECASVADDAITKTKKRSSSNGHNPVITRNGTKKTVSLSARSKPSENARILSPGLESAKMTLPCVASGKGMDAPSADCLSQEPESKDYTSTTTIGPAVHEVSFATNVIMQSDSLAMIRPPSEKPHSISKRRQWIVWCGTNDEQDGIASLLGSNCVSIDGSTTMAMKIALAERWRNGEVPVMVTKPKIMGWGQNWQHCSQMLFLGLSDSYESYYQCIRRSWRFGQKNPVDVHVVVTDHETEIVDNVRRKEIEAETLSREIVQAAREFEMEELGKVRQHKEEMGTAVFEGKDWRLVQGDCIDGLRELPESSVDLSIFSPPFIALYTYSASERDLGNCKSADEFFGHFRFVIEELLRVTKPGRHACVHVAQVAATLNTHGYIGLIDFRGKTVEAFERGGWHLHGEVVVDKDPQAQAIRTHSKGLLFVQLKKDSSWLRPALADYILVFRKPGENAVPVHPDISNDEWIEWARPIWYGIRESETLNAAEARSEEDDRHVCPLQLGTIERCIRLWSNTGETVLSPFAGIGSEGYKAVQLGRKFIGFELKPLYARTAARNLTEAARSQTAQEMFDFSGTSEVSG